MLTWTAIKTFFSGIVGKIVLIGGAVAAFVGWLALNNWKQRRKGRDELRADQRDELDNRLEKRESDEGDIESSPDDTLIDELRPKDRSAR